MPQLTNMIISKVYEGKSGDTKGRSWTAYSLYFTDEHGTQGKKKFGYFQSGNKPVPREGMKAVFVEYEIEKKGEYTNYNIKEIKFDQTPQTAQVEPSKETNGETYIDHGKVMVDLMAIAGYDKNKLFDLIILFKEGIEEITNPLPEKPQEEMPGPEDDDEPPPPDEEPDF